MNFINYVNSGINYFKLVHFNLNFNAYAVCRTTEDPLATEHRLILRSQFLQALLTGIAPSNLSKAGPFCRQSFVKALIGQVSSILLE